MNSMKYLFLCYLSGFLLLNADTLPQKLLSLDPSELNGTVKIVPQEKSEQEKKSDKLKDAAKKPIDGVTIELLDINISKDTTINMDYAPPLKQGELIDNQEKTTIKIKYRF